VRYALAPPEPPGNLVARPASWSRINLSWEDRSKYEDGFRIERKAGTNGAWSQVTTVTENLRTYQDTGLSPTTAYYYRLRSYNAAGDSAYSNETSATIADEPPAPPLRLSALPVSRSQISLDWSDGSTNEQGFAIERKTVGTGLWRQVATAAENAAHYEDLGLTTNTAYWYQVQAYNPSGISPYSNETSATTWDYPPAVPLNLRITAVSSDTVSLAWQDNSDNEQGFSIVQVHPWAEVGRVGMNVTMYQCTALLPWRFYSFHVRAYNSGGYSASSNVVSTTTLEGPPAAPRNLTVTAVTTSSIGLAWEDDSWSRARGYTLERKTSSTGSWSVATTLTAAVRAYENTGLTPRTSYYYRVRAYNTGGHSPCSNEVFARTCDVPPAAPSDLAVRAVSISSITIGWRDNSNNEQGFAIENKNGFGWWWPLALVGADVSSYQQADLSSSTIYHYRVRSYNLAANSPYSNEISIRISDLLPAAPTNLTASALGWSQILLSWRDNSNNEIGFGIERRTGSAASWLAVATAGMNARSFRDMDLAPGTLYCYRVRALGSLGQSLYSNEAAVFLPPNRLAAWPHWALYK
jgi:fibronectin type 3 domain-containing protein